MQKRTPGDCNSTLLKNFTCKNLSNVFILGVISYSVYEVIYLGFGDLC